MDYKNWKVKKDKIVYAEYSEVIRWCNEHGYHIEDVDGYYQVVKNSPIPEPSLEERVQILEGQYGMNRWQREGILAEGSLYSDYTKAHAQEIEDLAEELRK